jgi:uridine kinase
MRDTEDRRMPLDDVLQQYVAFVKPTFEKFILPVINRLSFVVTMLTNVTIRRKMKPI